ncbi:RNA-binding protein Musashi homolog 2 [Lutzomyia longipalpis]|uniref:RNA-binding protein Musashi homolog 2 n=1 Tax=Lutzomyia longipalpis TaxID=7200 RepID=UPI0024833CF2|nr:RNA-binding protein Musashi homolog 2 [Lutzomyia longipalpis]XP_055682852.1 RNA-binding protein Musashi homolog 2 [Lutzomyia longipalpis]XP_055682866.1 RNA-binding protein Musashi homolog 2 [Lutzomyia longipalpis]XP_055682872.1 RNA-binding protein Musashi homolog 2 [Lutzomyia longipalpis]XP_055682881.1 RNA-binding protein Musashi homolog 2 [Lutzomyia longipalpis]XP_055682891.1 RNA-binding protein Musashi homolog 2 [Lutzomyia longipalpis]XP_055682899.1 RNA-binding protein Musashi homolog 2 
MLFENPAVAAKLPFPYNIPPPMQAAAGVPQISAGLETKPLIDHDLQNALIAINPMNGTAVNGAINGTTNSHSSSSGRSTPNTGTDPAPGKLFVGGLSWQTSADKLKEYFGMFGTVTDVLIMKDPVTQRSRGFGFITFSDPSSVEKVLKVPIHTLDGKKIDPKHATPKNRPKQANKTKKIFVGGVSQDTSADEVKGYFSQFGKVEETVMLMDQQTKRHRGFGFVTFENEDVVDRVCEIHFHTIKNKKVECKKAQPKEAVTPAAQLLQKRLMLGGLGVRMAAPAPMVGPAGTVAAANPLAVVQAQAQAAQAAAAALQVQNAAAAGFGKVFTTYPPTIHSFRYAPYPIPAGAAAAAAHAATAPQPQPQPAAPPTQTTAALAATPVAPGNPYQGYSLTNVDMSSFQGVDWGSMYGMGMYV